FDYVAFRQRYSDLSKSDAFTRSNVNSINLNGNLTFQYRSNDVEVRLGGGTRYTKSLYSANPDNNLNQFDNNLQGSFTWTWDLAGMTFKSDMDYRWYSGYKVDRESEAILNAEISKLIFNKRATIALSAYDLLGQTRNFSTSQSAGAYSESKNNSIGRYVLVSFTWRFGTFGGGSRRGGNSGGGFPGGGMPGGFGGRF
ncbi:MAG: outer membrane beta-barrel family protein, partial [Bacteroidales bacterium]|nr:outer membrane beta-barrel family protein [Bacteroidales bacterium]